jgi:integrase
MLDYADYDTRIFMLFLFDTGIRAPTEAFNIRVVDLVDSFEQLNIRDEISKTFGRQIRLMMCSQSIKKYIFDNNLKENDIVFNFEPATINKRLKSIGKKVLGDSFTIGRKAGKDLTMYDFRHSAACYWLPLYKSRNQLLYRFGWKKEEEIHYYTELLGMKDMITKDDMVDTTTKNQMERQIERLTSEMDDVKAWVVEMKRAGKLSDENLQILDEKGNKLLIKPV